MTDMRIFMINYLLGCLSWEHF